MFYIKHFYHNPKLKGILYFKIPILLINKIKRASHLRDTQDRLPIPVQLG